MGVLFFLFWIILNGRVTTEIVIFGIVISLFLYVFSWIFIGYKPQHELLFFRNLPLVIAYLFVLIKEVVVATVVMAGFVFNMRDIPEPVIVHFPAPVKSSFFQVVLANSISLTPGTITVRVRDGEFQVHCYDKSMAKGIDDSVFVHLLKRMEESF
ncbi:Na+/H+ antiporter subunit E [Butyrivibrio sp. AE2032]|uniref:Na+/H+ antiporter subunit E n=1 Tax=Butyrivibrio sp. AE2032 TaxID=1458463 RepID=UPI000553D95B|nr:Na+/H+ antiporter subunit E [Butyrivibrio sp. AE2032]